MNPNSKSARQYGNPRKETQIEAIQRSLTGDRWCPIPLPELIASLSGLDRLLIDVAESGLSLHHRSLVNTVILSLRLLQKRLGTTVTAKGKSHRSNASSFDKAGASS